MQQDNRINEETLSLPAKGNFTYDIQIFFRPHLDFDDTLYDKPEYQNFINKAEKVQHKACLAITGAIQRTLRELFYDHYHHIRLDVIK